MRDYCVYILRCADDTLYVGMTNDVERRVAEHGAGIDPGCYTFTRRPIVLVHVAEFSEVMDAIAFEKKIKRWSRRKKEALIRGAWHEIQKAAVCNNDSHCRNMNIDKIENAIRSSLQRVTLSGVEGRRADSCVVPRLRSG